MAVTLAPDAIGDAGRGHGTEFFVTLRKGGMQWQRKR